jgi:hypothetical protein
MRRAGHVARVEELNSADRIVSRRPSGKKRPGRFTDRWEEIITCNI